MASKTNDEKAAVKSELERLREILFGEFEQSTESRLEGVEAHLAQFRREMLKSLDERDSQQGYQIEATRSALEERLDKMAAEMQQEFQSLRRDMDAHVAALRHELTGKQVLGRLLIDLGQQVKGDDAPDTES